MKDLIKVFVISLLFITAAIPQHDSKVVYIPETAASDSFRTPAGNYYLSAIKFLDEIPEEDAITSIYFLVTDNPRETWDTLKYDDAGTTTIYTVEVPANSLSTITLDFSVVYPYEWWKLLLNDAVADSTRFKAIYKQFR